MSRALTEISRQTGSVDRVDPNAAAEFVQAARFHRIAPLAHVATRRHAPELSVLLQADYLRAAMVHLQACGALHQLDSLLSDIEWLTFKGPVFSELAHPLAGLRTYNDVDVLVAPRDLREVSQRLVSAGWRLADFQDMLRNPAVPGEMHWISPGGALIDLHWSMINMASRRQLFRIASVELLERRVPVSLGSRPAWALALPDSLVHACLHAALTGANKLIYLIDVDRLSATVSDWTSVVARAKEWRAEAQVALVLMRAHQVLDTQFPASLVEELAIPQTLRALVTLADRVSPVPEVRRNTGISRFVARAVQPTFSETMRVAGRNATRGINEALHRSPQPMPHRQEADHASLEAYLTAVESVVGG